MPDEELHGKVDRILLILQGNGNPSNGLVTKHELLTQSVNACQSRHDVQKKDVKWIVTTVIAIGLGIVAILK